MSNSSTEKENRFAPTICVTQRCNLNCVYCYQKHDSKDMDFETAKKCVDYIFDNVPKQFNAVEIDFIGGEPLVRFDLLKQIFNYVCDKKVQIPYLLFATTNGTLLDDEMKKWFTERKDYFVLGLSLDGTPETHNHNRSNSFSKIDIEFFKKNWPFQDVKMTLSEFSLEHLAENIKYLHSLGYKSISGVNLFEGSFDWNQEKFIKMMIPQLEEIVDFYVDSDTEYKNQMLDKSLMICEAKREKRKYCGIGDGTVFFDVDGIKRPCSFCSPMTFDEKTLEEMSKTDFTKEELFVDDDCFENCYIYPICPNCSGANYLAEHSFKKRNRSKCRIQKLISIFIADLQVRKILKNPDKYSDTEKFKILEAAKKIKSAFLPEFSEYFE